MGEKITPAYPHREAFLRYAAANCGLPALYDGSHEEVIPESSLLLQVPEKPQNAPYVKWRPVIVKVRAVRAAELEANHASVDRPFEGTVVRSGHKEMKRGHAVIGLISRDCEALLMDATNEAEMSYLVGTFSDPAYRAQVTV